MKKNNKYTNWSGSQEFFPQQVYFPTTEIELASFLKKNKDKSYRIIGTGHSFSPLVNTECILINLDKMQGIINTNHTAMEVEVWAGTKIHLLNELLHKESLALINMGDIDRQSIAGAIGSGTHGTGIGLGILSTAVVEITIITPDGDIKTCSDQDNPGLYKCALVNLGVLGVVTRIKIKVMKAYKLHLKAYKETFEDCLENLDRYVNQNRHYEFFWFPYTKTVQSRISNITTDELKEMNPVIAMLNAFLEKYVFYFLSQVSKNITILAPLVSKLCSFLVGSEDRINYSHKIFVSQRDVKFQETEIAIPVNKAAEALRKIDKIIRENDVKVHFPIEVRFTNEDDIPLSPCYKQGSCFIAFHMYQGMEYKKYFQLVENTLKDFGGKPHWGKMSSIDSNDFNKVYPGLDRFKAMRRIIDPQGLFLNKWLHEVLN